MRRETESHRVKDRVLSKARQFLVVFVYVWLLLAIFGLHKSIVLTDERLVFHQGFAVLKALAVAKIIFLGEEMNFGKGFENRPLIWPVLFRSVLFAAVLVAFDILEKAALDRFFPRAAAGQGDGFDWRNLGILLSVGLLTFAALIPFFAIRELGKVFGEAKLYDLFFKRRMGFAPVETEMSPDHHENAPANGKVTADKQTE
jgi:hypothetical protein